MPGLRAPPGHGSDGVVDLANALASLSGAGADRPTSESSAIAGLIGPSDHLVFVLADGVGMNLLESLPATSFLSTHLARELLSTFPSTTAVALTSLATCDWPNRHGVTGWWTHLAEIGRAVALLPFETRSDGRSLADLGVRPRQAFPLPSVMGRATRDTLSLLPAQIAGSVFSAYFSGGEAVRGYRTLRDAVRTGVARVRAAAGPTYTYLYWARVDDAAHRHGVGHRETGAAVGELDRELQRLEEGLDGRGRIVMSADHGFLDSPEGAKHRIRPSDALMTALRSTPSGDARVLYLHVRAGAEGLVRSFFEERCDGRFYVITTEEAEGLGLFGPGPLSPQTRDRVGDVVVVSKGADVIEYRPAGGVGKFMHQASHHSGLTPAEMRVPLVLA